MRHIVYLLLLTSAFYAQAQGPNLPDPADNQGTFYVDGIVYQYMAGAQYTVVAAAHSAINHKFAAVKVRIYNFGAHSISVTPADVVVADAVTGRELQPVPGEELARRMRRTYNMARLGVRATPDADADSADPNSGVDQQMLQMMRAMSARANATAQPASNNLLYTDTPGALQQGDIPRHAECDRVCHLRLVEARGTDVLAQLQRQNTPEYVEQSNLRANTIPPNASVEGVLYFPLGKLAQEALPAKHTKKARSMRVTVPIGDECFQFLLPVE